MSDAFQLTLIGLATGTLALEDLDVTTVAELTTKINQLRGESPLKQPPKMPGIHVWPQGPWDRVLAVSEGLHRAC